MKNINLETALDDDVFENELRNIKIATIIACRLKSTRLPKKALLKIGDLSSIELCIKNALKFKHVNYTVLATSNLKDDAELKDHTYRKDVLFYAGDPEDVIRRYLDVVEKYNIDVIVRVTGDMPYVSDDIYQVLLKSHLENSADYTVAKNFAIGTNIAIIKADALRRINKLFPTAEYSEYMAFYFRNNPSIFKLNCVDLPNELIRDYRLTLDYKEDLEMFRVIEAYFKTEKLEFNIKRLFEFLDNNPHVVNINGNLKTRTKSDNELVEKLNKATTIISRNIASTERSEG